MLRTSVITCLLLFVLSVLTLPAPTAKADDSNLTPIAPLAEKLKRALADQKAKELLNESYFHPSFLVEKADSGNLAAQLEVARRLEIGEKFRQHPAMAFFWYQRALHNGGGETAKAGLGRLFHQLGSGNFMSIDIWTRNNHRPY